MGFPLVLTIAHFEKLPNPGCLCDILPHTGETIIGRPPNKWHTSTIYRTQGGGTRYAEAVFSGEKDARKMFRKAAEAGSVIVEVCLWRPDGRLVARVNTIRGETLADWPGWD